MAENYRDPNWVTKLESLVGRRVVTVHLWLIVLAVIAVCVKIIMTFAVLPILAALGE